MSLLKKLKKPETKNLNVKISAEDLDLIKEMAEKYAGGNVTAWIRYSATRFTPKASELTK